MRHITTFEYICLLFTHNTGLAFHKLQMVFYRIFDFFEEAWWVHVTPKKSKGDYHMFKMCQSMSQNGNENISRIMTLMKLLEKLQYSEQEQRHIRYLFYPLAYLRFMIDRELLDQMSIVCSVKDCKDIMDAGDLLGFGFRDKYRTLYGVEALATYEAKGNES